MWDFVVDKVALVQVISEYFAVSHANYYSAKCSTLAPHPGLVQ
jgi:hypothetical protein